MRITTNFAPGLRDLALALSAVLWLAAAAGVAVSASLWVQGVRAQRARPALVQRLDALRARVQGIGRADLPSGGRLEALRQRVATINALAGVSGWPLTRVLARLEALLPGPARLVSLDDKADTGEITLTAEAPTARTLTDFLARLQAQAHFKDVLLTKQESRTHGGEQWVRCTVRMSEAGS